MANSTAIEWCDLTWNPTHGCSKVSPGCAHCYAAELSLRYGHTSRPWTPANAAENVTVKPGKLREPLSKAKEWRGLGAAAAAAGKTDGKLVFVNSMSDLFHEQISESFIAEVFGVMAAAATHTFQVLTKRPERMEALLNTERFWETVNALCLAHGAESPVQRSTLCLPNCWLGVSIENRRYVGRADDLRSTPAAIRFISAEPLLGPLVAPFVEERGAYGASYGGEFDWGDDYDGDALDLTGIDWLIVGGESGPGHRPMRVEWVRDLRDACGSSRTALFVKQGSGAKPGKQGDLSDDLWAMKGFPQVVAP